MEKMRRTATCGSLAKKDEGRDVILNGWVHRIRNHGGIFFINLRDRYGITQVVVDGSSSPGLAEAARDFRMEWCLAVEGVVRARPDSMVNPDMATGEVEVAARAIEVLSASETPPFMIDESTNAGEELRLRHRYLDLRSLDMQRNIAVRSAAAFSVRKFMVEQGFLEIETPTFVRSTPEGARDYLVPSRLYHGKFYALPQSPQVYKQLLMVAGFDKYFQIARCYRDEDARGDRQPEFTQIDIEMSFASREDVLFLTEGLMRRVFAEVISVDLPEHFARLSYEEAIDTYGTDKPDLRFEMKMQDAAFLASMANDSSPFRAFADAVAAGGKVKALRAPGVASQYSRKKIEELEAAAKVFKAKALYWMKASGGALEGGIAKFFASNAAEVRKALGAEDGDLLLFTAENDGNTACAALGAVRSKLGKDLGLCPPDKFSFVWVLDFPLFEWNEEEGKWDAAHHMFTMPQEQYIDTLESDPASVKGDLYDLVLNGYELASGSIRIHDSELQKRIFRIIGLSDEEGAAKFGFLTEAFKYGAPPHGGIAPGFDRLVMLMCGKSSIKDVIAFPKNSFAQSLMDGAPSDVDPKQLEELGLAVSKNEEGL